MAKRPEPEAGRPSLTPERAIARLTQRIAELEEFDPTEATERWAPDVTALQTAIDETLSNAFGHDSVDYRRYSSAKNLDDGPLILGEAASPWEVREYLTAGKTKSIKLLQQAVRSLKERIEDAEPSDGGALLDEHPSAEKTRDIFVVHGRDEGAREAVARFLERLKFHPIILHEKANQGRTVIEKIEAHSGVGFAVVLLTADDVGNMKGEPPHPRARQNVLLELGYFVGLLGRRNVCAFQRGDIEIPSDWRGVVNEAFDDNGAWKQALARELQEAGYAVDWNLVMGR